ncbi:MAG TPA: helix-turn-helix domain-containing protein [Thermoanaerobaculia bacterium]|nr:helix-turn-helix domain-containing protein [Thermoanaerobaculia bacterium]
MVDTPGTRIGPYRIVRRLGAGAPAARSGASPGASQDYHEALNEAKRRIIRDALAASGGNVTRAAEGLGLHANHLHRLMTSLGLR